MSFFVSHPVSFPRLSCIALLVAGIGLASCGSDDDSPPPAVKQADQVGALHGVLAEALREELGIGAPLTDMSAPVEALQDIVILSDPNGIRDDHPALALMKDAFHSGRAVVLENVDADEVNTLIKALGVRISGFTLPEGASVVELFAVRQVKGDTWFFVDVGTRQPIGGANTAQGAGNVTFNPDESYDYCNLSGDEQPEVKINVCGKPNAGADGEEAALQQAQCDTRPLVLGAASPLSPTLAKAIRTQTDTQAQKGLPESCRDTNGTCGATRTRALLDWAQAGREEAGRVQSVVRIETGDKLGDLVAKNAWQIVYSPGCRTFTTKYDIYAYHSFEQDMDYYFISQYGDFDPGACWQNLPATCNSGDGAGVGSQEGYIRFYEFEHALPGNPQDPKYGGYGHEVLNPTHSPVTTGQDATVSVQTNKSVGGSIGFSMGWGGQSEASLRDAKPSAGGLGASASLSAGMSTSTGAEYHYKDGAVEFTAQGRQMGGLNWRYDFLRPCSAPGQRFCFLVFEYGELQDATKLSKGTFSPQQEWTWAVPSKYSREYFLSPGERGEEGTQRGFKTHFEAMAGASEAFFSDTTGKIAGHGTRHRCQTAMKTSWYVPLSRPPLLAVDQDGLKDFPVGGGSQKVNLASEYDWKVSDKPDWVTVEPMSGEPTRKMSESERAGWNGSMDLRVTVYKDDTFNESSQNRSGYVKLCAKGSDGNCITGGEEAWIKVTQVPFNN